jgi:tetratricopeptide (TPR) repeat protein
LAKVPLSFQSRNDKLKTGYQLELSGKSAEACKIWLTAWNDFLQILDASAMRSIDEFDRHFNGDFLIFNWLQDLEMTLWNTGLKQQQFLTDRISVFEECLSRFSSKKGNFTDENWRRAIAESYFELGKTSKADELYRQWLSDDPEWGWGWIGWSDCYGFKLKSTTLERAEQILKEGLAIGNVSGRLEILERLAHNVER